MIHPEMDEGATRAKQFRDHAKNARASAEATTGEFCKSFMQLADDYKTMALEVAQNDQPAIDGVLRLPPSVIVRQNFLCHNGPSTR
jgi:hypothetical protein